MNRRWWKRLALAAVLLLASTVVLIWLYGDWLMAEAYKITLEGPSQDFRPTDGSRIANRIGSHALKRWLPTEEDGFVHTWPLIRGETGLGRSGSASQFDDGKVLAAIDIAHRQPKPVATARLDRHLHREPIAWWSQGTESQARGLLSSV